MKRDQTQRHPITAQPRPRPLLAGIPLLLLLLALLPLLPGCSSAPPLLPPVTTHQSAHVPHDMVPLGEAAYRLGLDIEQASPQMASLSDGRHTVVILAPPTQRVSLNGRPITAAHVQSINGQLYLSTYAISQLQTGISGQTPAISPTRVVRNPVDPVPAVPAALPRVSGRVVLDAGHGGRDPGAVNRYGPDEKHIVLDITLRTRALLVARGVRVYLTRSNDSFPSLEQRVEFSNKLKPDLFASIHADHAPDASASGFTIYIARQASQQSVVAGNRIAAAMQTAGIRSRGVRRADFVVIQQTTSPAVLIETGYLSNPRDSRNLSTPTYRQAVAQAIANGIIDHLSRR